MPPPKARACSRHHRRTGRKEVTSRILEPMLSFVSARLSSRSPLVFRLQRDSQQLLLRRQSASTCRSLFHKCRLQITTAVVKPTMRTIRIRVRTCLRIPSVAMCRRQSRINHLRWRHGPTCRRCLSIRTSRCWRQACAHRV